VRTNQFSLKFLLSWMTICAVLIVTLHGLVFKGREVPDGLELTLMAVSSAVIFLIHLPAGCIPLVVLSRRPRGRMAVLSTLLWAGLVWFTIETMLAAATKFGIMPNDRERITSFVIWAQAGAVAASAAAALVLRLAGFRLFRPRGIMTVADSTARSQGARAMATTKPLYDKKEFARRGEAIYKLDIEPTLTNVNEGDFVAIDIETGQYEIDPRESAAADRLLSRVPNAQTWVRRVGSPYICRFGLSRMERT
jgi:hypothetical protein